MNTSKQHLLQKSFSATLRYSMIIPARAIHEHLTVRAKRIVVVPHKNPDGDTLGAATAFLHYLKSHGVAATLWCKTGTSSALNFLPHTDELRCDPTLWEREQFDTVCVFDASDLTFCGVADRITALARTPFVINFDHHYTNTRFGNINVIDLDAASTTEIVYNYLRELGEPIPAACATSLLTGLMTDTGNFSNPATSERALTAGALLMRAGGNYQAILAYTYRNKTPRALRLWGRALERLVVNRELQLAYTVLTHADVIELGGLPSELEGVANFLNGLGEVPIALVLQETSDGLVKGSLRTTRDDIDVSALAGAFGGGGHRKAAGFSVRGRLEQRDGQWVIVAS